MRSHKVVYKTQMRVIQTTLTYLNLFYKYLMICGLSEMHHCRGDRLERPTWLLHILLALPRYTTPWILSKTILGGASQFLRTMSCKERNMKNKTVHGRKYKSKLFMHFKHYPIAILCTFIERQNIRTVRSPKQYSRIQFLNYAENKI